MKVWNLNVKRGVDGSKHLDIQLHGVIDGGWMDDDGVNTADLVAEMQQHLDAKTIGVRINSIGGSAFGGVALYNALQAHPGDVTCCVEGLAASAASLVAMAGKTVMGRGSMMMIHSPSTMAMGNAEELRRTADVLDKVQDSLASIYTAKTGKSPAEINDLLDDETWMTADEAVAAGFADSVGDPMGDDGDEDPLAGNEEEPQMLADGVVWCGVRFPLAALPQQVLAMAKKLPPTGQTPAPAAAAVLAIVPPLPPESPLERAELARRAPELLAALLNEGRASGVAAERARLQAIDELGVRGCTELVAAAKYGDAPMDAPALAVAIVKAGQQAGADLLALRRTESKPLAAVVAGSPDKTAASDEARIIKAMTDGGNASRGGNVR